MGVNLEFRPGRGKLQPAATSRGHPSAGSGQQGEQNFLRCRRDSFLVPCTLGFHSTIALRFSFLQCRNQSAPVTHQDQGCRPERVRMMPVAAMAAPENRRCPTRVHVLRLAPMTDLWLPKDGASGTNPWWLTAEAHRSSFLPLQNRCPVGGPFKLRVLAMALRASRAGCLAARRSAPLYALRCFRRIPGIAIPNRPGLPSFPRKRESSPDPVLHWAERWNPACTGMTAVVCRYFHLWKSP